MTDEQPPTMIDRVKSRLQLSVAATATVVVGVVLLLVASIAWLVYSLDPSRVAWGDYMSIGQGLSMLALWVLSCLFTYWSVRLWMQQPPVGESALHDSWSRGTNWIASHGVDLKQMPCFVVLGSSSRYWQEQLFEHGRHLPHSPEDVEAPIDWVLADDHVLLVCRHVGVYSRLIEKMRARTSTPITDAKPPFDLTAHRQETGIAATSGPVGNLESPETAASSEIVATGNEIAASGQSDATPIENDPLTAGSEPESSPPEPGNGSRPLRSREKQLRSDGSHDGHRSPLAPLDFDETGTAIAPLQRSRSESMPSESESHPALDALKELDQLVQQASRDEATSPTDQERSEPVPQTVLLDSLELVQSQDAISRLCTCLKGCRYPLSPINGVLVVADPEQMVDEASARAIGRAVRSDLEQIQGELGVISPVTTLVIEHPYHDDVAELSRRLATSPRLVDAIAPNLDSSGAVLGRAFDPAGVPTQQALSTLVDQTIASIRNRIEDILGSPESLTQPSNHRLVRLSIRFRFWSARLQQFMTESCGTIRSYRDSDAEPLMSTGLFFAGLGSGSLLRRFTGAAIDQMKAQQDHLQWTAAQLGQHAKQRTMLRWLVAATCLLAFVLLAQMWLALR